MRGREPPHSEVSRGSGLGSAASVGSGPGYGPAGTAVVTALCVSCPNHDGLMRFGEVVEEVCY